MILFLRSLQRVPIRYNMDFYARLLLLFVAVGLVAYKIRARVPDGILRSSTFHTFVGSTFVMKKQILREKTITPPEFNLVELQKNGWKAFVWGHLGGKMGLTVVEPEDVKFILKDNFNNFLKADDFLECMEGLLGGGIFNSNGDQWKEQRVVAAHMFNRRQLRDRMSHVFGTHAQEMVQIVKKGNLNVQTLFYHYTFDAINSIAFNKSVSSMKGNERDCEFQNAFDLVQSNVITRFFVPWWKLHRYFQSSEEERVIKDNMDIIDRYVAEVVESYYDGDEIKEEALAGDQTMTGLFLDHAKSENKKYSKKFIRDMILNFVIAGRDTTGSALTSCVELLTQHPEWQDKLIEEAKLVFAGNLQEPLTFDDIEGKSPVAEAVFMEALRLHPSVPGNEKISVKDTTFPSGVKLPAGTHVTWVPLATNRYKKAWGEDADEFNPTRWMGEKAATYNDYMYSTFNAGPRLCLGKNMAVLEGKIALLTLFAHYRFFPVSGFTPKLITSVTWQLNSDGLEVEAVPL